MRLNALTCATVLATASVVAATEGFDPREYAKLKKHTTCKAVKRDEGDKRVDINMSESVSPPRVLPTPLISRFDRLCGHQPVREAYAASRARVAESVDDVVVPDQGVRGMTDERVDIIRVLMNGPPE